MAIKSDRPPSEPPTTHSGSEPSSADRESLRTPPLNRVTPTTESANRNSPGTLISAAPSYSNVTSGRPSHLPQVAPQEPVMTEQTQQQPAPAPTPYRDEPARTTNERTPFFGNTHNYFDEADKRARKRAVWAWVWGIIIWVVLGLIFGKAVASAQRKNGGGGSAGHGGNDNGDDAGDEKKTYPGAIHCDSYAGVTRAVGPGPFTVSTLKLDLPLGVASDLYFHSEGPFSHGAATFLTEGPPGGKAWVGVNALWDDLDVLHESQVCIVKNGKEIGVELWFGPLVLCPRLPHSSISLNSIRVDASIFSIYLPDGAPQLKDSLILHTTNAAIVISAPVETRKIDLLTSNAAINFIDVGTINGKDSLVAVTKNGAINTDSLAVLRSPDLQLITTNGAIEALNVDSLGNLTALNTNGKITLGVELIASDHFNVQVATSNAAVDVAFVRQRVGSQLIGSFSSKNGGVDLELDQEYQGSFEVTYGAFMSPKITPPVDVYNDQHDGKRSFIMTGRGKGETSWADGKKKAFGDVKISTSNARTTLAFECDKTF